MAAASAPDLGLTGAENLRGTDGFFLVSVDRLGIRSGKDKVELDGEGSAEDLMMVLTWLLLLNLDADKA
jgi:hypothetical protein